MSYPQQPAPDQPGANPDPYGQQPPPQYGGGYGPPTPPPLAGDPGTLDLPWYGIGFVDAVKRALQKYARFDGRASRSEFWWFMLGLFLVELVLYIPLTAFAAADMGILAGLVGVVLAVVLLALVVPYIAVGVRRLHDGGFSGWLMLLAIVPIASLALIVLWILPSKPEGAKYDKVAGAAPGGYGGRG